MRFFVQQQLVFLLINANQNAFLTENQNTISNFATNLLKVF